MRDIVEVAVTKTKAVLKLFGNEKRLHRRRKREHDPRSEDRESSSASHNEHARVSQDDHIPGVAGLGRSLSKGDHGSEDVLFDLAHPYTGILKADFGIKADGVSFQPCKNVRNQDRYVVEQFVVNGGTWTLTGVFDGHLGDATVEHTAHHLPVIVQEYFQAILQTSSSLLSNPDYIASLLSRAIASFDAAITQDVWDMFHIRPSASIEEKLAALDKLSDEEIRLVINDKEHGWKNYRKVQLCMYGTTALVCLVDPHQENLWVANLGDCQAVFATRDPVSNTWTGELLTDCHNGSNPKEVSRVRSEHPDEDSVIINDRVLGAIAPFRCIGDQPFKQPPAFTRRILYNLDSASFTKDQFNGVASNTMMPARATSTSSYVSCPPARLVSVIEGRGVTTADTVRPWEQFLARNLSPPYISSQAQVVHRSLSPVLGRGVISPPRSPVTSLSSSGRPSLSLMNYPPISSPVEAISINRLGACAIVPQSRDPSVEIEQRCSSVPNHFIILCTDGLQDLFAMSYPVSSSSSISHGACSTSDSPFPCDDEQKSLIQRYVDVIVHGGSNSRSGRPASARLPRLEIPDESPFQTGENLALRLLRAGLVGEDNDEEMISAFLAGPDCEDGVSNVGEAWLDDITVVVQTL